MSTTTTPPIGQQRLVRQIVRAVKATNRLMFWDIEMDEADILERLTRDMAHGYAGSYLMESVVQSILMSHEDYLRDAVNDQCRQAMRTALDGSAVRCPCCLVGHPMQDGFHIPTQRLGMISEQGSLNSEVGAADG